MSHIQFSLPFRVQARIEQHARKKGQSSASVMIKKWVIKNINDLCGPEDPPPPPPPPHPKIAELREVTEHAIAAGRLRREVSYQPDPIYRMLCGPEAPMGRDRQVFIEWLVEAGWSRDPATTGRGVAYYPPGSAEAGAWGRNNAPADGFDYEAAIYAMLDDGRLPEILTAREAYRDVRQLDREPPHADLVAIEKAFKALGWTPIAVVEAEYFGLEQRFKAPEPE